MALNETSPQEGGPVLSTADYVTFGLLIATTAGIALWTFFKNKNTTEDFFTAKNSLGIFPVAMSLLSSFTNAIFILSYSGEAYGYGLELFLQMVGAVFGMFIITYSMLKLFYDLKLVTVYEYFERRYESGHARRVLTTIQLSLETFSLGINAYAPSLILSTITNISLETYIIIIAVLAAVYSTIGGMRGVIWTDTFMLLVIVVGLTSVIVTGCLELGGVAKVWHIAEEGGRTRVFNFDPNPIQRQNSYFAIFSGFLLYGFRYGSSQISLQRLYAAKSFESYQRSLVVIVLCFLLINTLNFGSGIVAYSLYAGCDPLEQGRIKKIDQILPYMVSDKLSYIKGLSGLFLACLVCAALSTLTSVMNGFSMLIYSDFLKRLNFFKKSSERVNMITCKSITMFLCVPVIGVALIVSKSRSLIEIMIVALGIIAGPLHGVYCLAMFFPRTNLVNAILGFLISLTMTLWFGVGRFMTHVKYKQLPFSADYCHYNGTDYSFYDQEEFNLDIESSNMYAISFHFFDLFGTLTCIAVGFISSYLPGPFSRRTDVHPDLISPLVRRFLYKTKKEETPKEKHQNNDKEISSTRL